MCSEGDNSIAYIKSYWADQSLRFYLKTLSGTPQPKKVTISLFKQRKGISSAIENPKNRNGASIITCHRGTWRTKERLKNPAPMKDVAFERLPVKIPF